VQTGQGINNRVSILAWSKWRKPFIHRHLMLVEPRGLEPLTP
jgi:hypothetical protein